MTIGRKFKADKEKNYQEYLELAKKYFPERLGYSFHQEVDCSYTRANTWFMFEYDSQNATVQARQLALSEPYLRENSQARGEFEEIFTQIHRKIRDLPEFSEIQENALVRQTVLGVVDENYHHYKYAGFKLHLSLRGILEIPQAKINQLCDFLLSYKKIFFDFKLANYISANSDRQDHEQFTIYLNEYTRMEDIKAFMREVEDFITQHLGLGAHRRTNDQSYYKDFIIFNGYLSGRIDSCKLTQNYGRFKKLDIALSKLIKSNSLDSFPIGIIDYIYNEILILGVTQEEDLDDLVKRIIANPQSYYEKIADLPKRAQQIHVKRKISAQEAGCGELLQEKTIEIVTAPSNEVADLGLQLSVKDPQEKEPTQATGSETHYSSAGGTLFKKIAVQTKVEPLTKASVVKRDDLFFTEIIDKVLSQMQCNDTVENIQDFKEDLRSSLLQLMADLTLRFTALDELEKIILSCIGLQNKGGCCFTKSKTTLTFDKLKLEKALRSQHLTVAMRP